MADGGVADCCGILGLSAFLFLPFFFFLVLFESSFNFLALVESNGLFDHFEVGVDGLFNIFDALSQKVEVLLYFAISQLGCVAKLLKMNSELSFFDEPVKWRSCCFIFIFKIVNFK